MPIGDLKASGPWIIVAFQPFIDAHVMLLFPTAIYRRLRRRSRFLLRWYDVDPAGLASRLASIRA